MNALERCGAGNPAQCHILLWGGPPGPRGSPWTRSVATRSAPMKTISAHLERADEGVGRGPGGPPHDLCRCSVLAKVCSIGQSCPQPAFSRLDPLESGSAAWIGCPTG